MQYLPQPQRIAKQLLWQFAGKIKQQLQGLFLGLEGDDIGQVIEHFIEAELDRLQGQLASFDLGEIEDVIDDAEQAVGDSVDLLHIVSLARRKLGLQGYAVFLK